MTTPEVSRWGNRYRRAKWYLIWIALIVLAISQVLGDFNVKHNMYVHFSEERRELNRINELENRIGKIEHRHADQDLQRFILGINPKEICK
jgi:hypothetical protein